MIEIVSHDTIIMKTPRYKSSPQKMYPPRELKLCVTCLSQVLKHHHFSHLGANLGNETMDTTSHMMVGRNGHETVFLQMRKEPRNEFLRALK